MTEQGPGTRALRKEDRRFLTGRGNYVGDLDVPGMLHMVVVRSDHAHGHLLGIDLSQALDAPGVVAAHDGRSLKAMGIGDLACLRMIKGRGGEQPARLPRAPLAVDRVRYVGEPIAVVVARSLEDAEGAADLIVVDIDPMPAVTGLRAALDAGAPVLWDELESNSYFTFDWGDAEETERVFSKADHVVSLDLVNARVIPNPIEPRVCVALPEGDRLTLHASHQKPHDLVKMMAPVIGLDPAAMRVVSPDVGGGFGAKLFLYPEETVVSFLAIHLQQPVRWAGSRSDAMLGDAHARDHETHAELALDKNGRFLAMRADVLAAMGGAVSSFAPAIPTQYFAPACSGVYKISAMAITVQGVFSNTAPVDAYRGAGRPEAAYIIERLADIAASRLGLDRAEIRRRNMIGPHDMPFITAGRLKLDTGDFPHALESALEHGDYASFAERKSASRNQGKLRGLGIASWFEPSAGGRPVNHDGSGGGQGGHEYARLRVHPDGTATLQVGTHNHGQGHETTYAQIVAARLGVPLDSINVRNGDTEEVSYGEGSFGSRGIHLAGNAAAAAADKVIVKGRKIAAQMLEASFEDIELVEGTFSVVGTDRSLSFQQVARSAYGGFSATEEDLEPGLDEHAFYVGHGSTFPGGCHLAEIEIDPETGVLKLERYVVADDVGVAVNPTVVEGQIHGGVTQGLGQAMLEATHYDQGGQLLTASFMDYTMPRADDLPAFELKLFETPCTTNPLGVKGAGEAGCVPAPCAIISAVADALGVEHIDMPVTSQTLWRALRHAVV
jgi:carbon-monoxide dehydrogenase large subunit